MLTIEEIKNVGFDKRGKGYDAEQVDEFVDDVIDAVEEKDAYIKKLESDREALAKMVKQYRKDEDTVKNALLVTQKSCDNMLKEAQEKAIYCKKAAEDEIKKKLVEAQVKNEKAKEKLMSIYEESASLKEELIALYNKHIEKLKNDLVSNEEINSKKDELDKKYPFEAQVELANDEIVETKETKEVKEVPSKQEEKETTEEVVRKPVEVQTKEEKKFNTLKFGDNYDVE